MIRDNLAGISGYPLLLLAPPVVVAAGYSFLSGPETPQIKRDLPVRLYKQAQQGSPTESTKTPLVPLGTNYG
jgi:hypothetical protein